MDYSPPGSSVHGNLQARILGWVPCPPPGDLPHPGIKLALQAGSLLLSPWGSPPVAEVFKIKSLTWPYLSDTISMYQINVSVSIAASFSLDCFALGDRSVTELNSPFASGSMLSSFSYSYQDAVFP